MLTFSTKAFAASYYWVGEGATSNINDTGNWSTVSGGVGGAGVPTTTDTVTFNGVNNGNTISGLVGYWKLDETATPAVDSSGNGDPNGTWVGSPTATTSVPSAIQFSDPKALNFNGTSQYIQAASASTIVNPNTSDLTLSTWINVKNFANDGTANQGVFMQNIDGSNAWMMTMGTGSTGTNQFTFIIQKGGVAYQYYTTNTFSTNTWYHLAEIWNHNTNIMQIYVNGTLQATTSTSGFGLGTADNKYYIGARSDGLGHFNGSLDDVRIYNRVLSAAEVTALAAGSSTTGGGVVVNSNSNATINTAWSVAGITITSGYSGTITQNSGVAFTVGTSGYSQAGGTFAGSTGNMTVAGSFTKTGGTYTNSGSLTFSGSAAATSTCSEVLSGTVIINKSWADGDGFTNASGCTISLGASPVTTLGYNLTIPGIAFTNRGTIIIPSGTWTINPASPGGSNITNNGTITHNGSGWVFTTANSFVNNGTITYSGSTVNFYGSFNQAGTFTAPGTLVLFGGGGYNSTLTCTGTFPNNVRVTETLSSYGFTLSSGCSINTEASPTWTIGNPGITNNGTITVPSGTWTITGNGGAMPITNNGTITHNGTSWVMTGAGVSLTNASTGIINASSLTTMTVSGSLTNATSSQMTLGATTLTVGSNFTQSGTFSGMTGVTIFNLTNNASQLTCTGNFPGTIRETTSLNYVLTISNGCAVVVDTSIPWVVPGPISNVFLTNNGTMTVNSGTWTINPYAGLAVSNALVNNGTITNNGSGWTFGGGLGLTNSAGATITYAGTVLNMGDSFNQSGTFDTTGKTVVFLNLAVNATLTCTGTFPGSINMNTNTYTVTLAAGCNTFGGDFTTSAGKNSAFALPASTNLSVAGNVNLGSTGTFGNATMTLTLTGAGKSLTLNGANISGIAGVTYGAAGQAFNYISGTYFASPPTFGTNVSSVNIYGSFASNIDLSGTSAQNLNIYGGTMSGTITFSGQNPSIFESSTSTISNNITFNSGGTALINLAGSVTAGTTTINSTAAALSGNSTFYNLVVNATKSLDTSPDGGTTIYNLTVVNNLVNNGTISWRSSTITFNDTNVSVTRTLGSMIFNNVILTSADTSSYTSTFTGGLNYTGNLTVQTTGGTSGQTHTWNIASTTTYTIPGNLTISKATNGATPILSVATATTWNFVGSGSAILNNGGTFAPTLQNFNGSGVTTYSSTYALTVGTTTINQSSGSVALSGNSTFYNLVINSGKILDASPDGGTTSYNLTVNYNFVNNAGATGLVTRQGTVTFYHSVAGAWSYITGGLSFYNLTWSNAGSCVSAMTNNLADSFSVTNLFSINSTYSCGVNSWVATTSVTITVSGSASMTGNAGYTTFGNSFVTLNMTGANKSFTTSSGVTFNANLNFNGSGITTVNTRGTWSTGTVTVNQPVGSSVALVGNTTFNNLVINSGNVFNAGPQSSTVYGASSGLVGYWKLDEPAGAGFSVDSSGSGNGGFWAAGPVATTSAPSALASYTDPYSLNFSGNTQYVNVGTPAVLNNMSAYTVSAWVNIPAYPASGANYRIFDKTNSSGASGPEMYITNTGTIASANGRYVTTAANSISNGTVPLNTWTHVLATIDTATGTIKIYLNGTETTYSTQTTGAGALTNSDAANSFGIGAAIAAATRYFVGSIDDVRVYNRVLTSAEITALSTGSTASTTSTTTAYTLTVNGNLTNSGTFNASPATTTVTGNFTMNAGSVFNHNNGLFNMNGSNQVITTNQDLNFYSFNKTVVPNAVDTLTFNSGYTYTMSGIATLQGYSNANKLYLNPSLNGTSWNINPSGTRNFSNLAPWYSNNINSIAINALNSASSTGNSQTIPTTNCNTAVSFCDRGFNVNWNFGSGQKAYWHGPAGGNVSGNYWASTSGGAAGSATISAAYQLFFDSTATTSAVFDASSGGTYAGIYIDPAYTGTITQARTLTLNSQGFVQNGGTFNGNGSTFTTNTFTLGGGTFNAPTTLTDTGTFTVSNGIYSASTTLNVAGSFIDNTTSGTTTLSSGLAGYWPLDETSPGPALDYSGNNNTGTWTGSPLPSPTSAVPVPPITFSDPYALTFNGSSQYVTTTSTTTFSAVTLSVWVKPNVQNVSTIVAGKYKISSTERSFGIVADSSSYFLVSSDGTYNANNIATIPGNIQTGVWTHIVGTWSAGDYVRVYVNGTLAGTSISTVPSMKSTSIPFWIANSNSGTDYFNGSIDDVRVYNRALSAAEVAALYQGRNSGTFAGGAFLANSGTVNLTGGSQSVISQGTTTFNNLTKTISSNATLTFSAGKVFKVLGTTNFAGASGQYLNLRSSQTGTQWKFLPNTSASPANTLNILNIQDSNNIATAQLVAGGGSIDNGNNINWLFSIPGTTIGWSGTQVATTTIPTSGVMLGGAFTASRTSSGPDLHITGITFKQNGSLSNSYISNLRLYYQQTAAGSCNSGLVYNGGVMSGGFGPATYTATGKYTFSTTTGEITATSIPVSYGTTTCLYLRYDLTGSQSIALVGQSIDLVISNPLTDVIMDQGNATPSSMIDIQGSNRATIIDGNSLGLGNVLSINTSDPTTNPTIYYVQNSALWVRQGTSTAVRLTPTTVTATGFSFVKSAPSNNTQVVKITLNINEKDPRNPQKPSYAKTFMFTATIRISSS